MDLEPGDNRARRVQWACLAFILLVFAWVMWEAYGPAPRIPASSLPPSTPPAEMPLAKARVFLQKATWGRFTPWVLGVLFLLLAAVTVRESRRGGSDDAPRLFALLVALLAVVPAAMWIGSHFALPPGIRARAGAPSLYYVAVAVPALFSAVYLFFGHRAARPWYGLALAFAVGWSFIEYGLAHKQFWAQVTMPVLVGFYLFSWRVSGRLASPGR